MRAALTLLLVLAPGLGRLLAAEPKPVYTWVAANEYYMALPVGQRLHLSEAGANKNVQPWALGIRAVGNGPFAQTGGLQLQSVKVDSPSTGRSTFYMLDLLLGMEFISPKQPGRPLRFTATGVADLGLSGSTFYAAPVISVGLLYTTAETARTPTGLTFDLYYRPTDIDLDDAGNGKAAALKPALGIKLGYIFEGFWTAKEKQ